MPDKKKDMKVRFHMSGDSVTVDDLIALEEGTMSERKSVFAKLLVTPQGNTLYAKKPEKALALIGKLTLSQLNAAAEELIEIASNSTVPKDKEKRSG